MELRKTVLWGFARIGVFLPALICFALVATAADGTVQDDIAEDADRREAADVVEHWYRVDVGDTPAGWTLSRVISRGDKLTTVSIVHLRFRRGGAEQTLELESRFVETTGGRPLSAWSRQDLALSPLETSWKFLADGILVETLHGGETRRQRVPLPMARERHAGGWLTPGQQRVWLRRLLAEGVERFTLSSLDPQLGLEIVDTEWLLETREAVVLVDGRPTPTRRFRQRQSFAPQIESVTDVDADGLVVRSATSMMGLEMTETLSTRDQVLAHRDAPDLLRRSFIYPDRSISEPRQARRAVFEVFSESGALSGLPSVGSQHVSPSPTGTRVLVEVGSSPVLRGEDRPNVAEYLRASTFIDHRDSAVRRLMEEALRSVETRAEARAEALRTFVAGHLRDKNLDSILATAGEVAESRSGDCTEHSVLLTAMLRATGIPARLVTGVIYVEEFAGESRLFGYHMWTQALIDDRWIDLDATLAVPFDAAHIAFSTTALNDDQATLVELGQLATFIGRAQIRVLEVVY